MARVEQLHKALELGVVLHSQAEVAHERYRVVVADDIGVRDALDRRHHGVRVGIGAQGVLHRLGSLGERRGVLGRCALPLVALRAARLAPPSCGALVGFPGVLGSLRRIVPGLGSLRLLRVGQRRTR